MFFQIAPRGSLSHLETTSGGRLGVEIQGLSHLGGDVPLSKGSKAGFRSCSSKRSLLPLSEPPTALPELCLQPWSPLPLA